MKNKATGKIGVFDSGIGGLVILKALRTKLPKYDYEYYGDTKNLPYGDKSQKEIFNFTIKGVKYLEKKGCTLIIIACNTASAKALRKIQKEWLPKHSPFLKVLGMIVPTVEFLDKSDFPALLIATKSTVNSNVYGKELKKIFPNVKLTNLATPHLVPLIEKGDVVNAVEYVKRALNKSLGSKKTLVLGCTHYPLIASEVQTAFPKLTIIDQTEIVPKALENYLTRHKVLHKELSRGGQVNIYFTKENAVNRKVAGMWF